MDESSTCPAKAVAASRFRLTMATLMVFILTSAVVAALFVRVRDLVLIPGVGTGATAALDVDIPAILILGISLNAIALGCWRRSSIVEVLLQIASCCLLVLSGIWLWDWGLYRTLRYWLQLGFAATVALPLLVARLLASADRGDGRARRAKRVATNLVLVFANFFMIMVVFLFESIGLLLIFFR